MWQQVVIALHQSVARILTKVAILLPALVALLLAIIVFTLLGMLISSLLRRMLFSIKFDERISEMLAPHNDGGCSRFECGADGVRADGALSIEEPGREHDPVEARAEPAIVD